MALQAEPSEWTARATPFPVPTAHTSELEVPASPLKEALPAGGVHTLDHLVRSHRIDSGSGDSPRVRREVYGWGK